MTKLLRQSLVAYGAPLCETIVDCPSPRGSEVLVRVERCGVCHSDLHMQDGYFKLGGDKRLDVSAGRALPFTLGHEIAGVVEERRPRRRNRTGARGSRSIHGSAVALARPAVTARRTCARRRAISGLPSMAAMPPMSSSRIRATSSTTRRCRRRWRAR